MCWPATVVTIPTDLVTSESRTWASRPNRAMNSLRSYLCGTLLGFHPSKKTPRSSSGSCAAKFAARSTVRPSRRLWSHARSTRYASRRSFVPNAASISASHALDLLMLVSRLATPVTDMMPPARSVSDDLFVVIWLPRSGRDRTWPVPGATSPAPHSRYRQSGLDDFDRTDTRSGNTGQEGNE